MRGRQADRGKGLSWLVWILGLLAIAILTGMALHILGVTPSDREQQQPLVWGLAQGDLAHAMAGGTDTLPQTSGPGFGLFAAPLYLLVRPVLSAEDGFVAVSYLCLVPLAVAAIAASRAVGVVTRSPRELLNVAAVVLGVPVLACYAEYFHPADVLATAAVLGAFALCARGRNAWAFAVLGFAVATRQWAVIAVLVLAVLLPWGTRLRLMVLSAATGFFLILPFLIADPDRTVGALAARDVVLGRLTAPAMVPLHGGPLYALSRFVPLLLAGGVCVWLNRRGVGFRPELAAAALAVCFLVRPVVDPAGFLYYLAPGYAFAVLLQPQSWRWPVGGLVGGVALWFRRGLRQTAPTFVEDETGRHLLLEGSALAIGTTLVLLLALLLAGQRLVELVQEQEVDDAPSDQERDSDQVGGGGPRSGSEAAAGGPGDAEAGDGVLR